MRRVPAEPPDPPVERRVGVELIKKAHHVVGLTDPGQAFLPLAKHILNDLRPRRPPRSPGAVGDLVALLESQHREDEHLFQRYSAATADDSQLIEEIISTLVRHSVGTMAPWSFLS